MKSICQFVAISPNHIATVFLSRIHNYNEFNHPYSTGNNALNIKAYTYSVEYCCLFVQE